MRSNRNVVLLVLAAAFLASSAATVAAQSIPIANWTPPSTWSPSSGGKGMHTAGDIGGPLPLVPVTPCRQFDSRVPPAPLLQNTNRTVTLSGAPCGIPAYSTAVAINITVFNIAGAAGNGVFQIGTAINPTQAWINYPSTETQRANAGVVATTGGQIFVRVQQGAGQVDFTVDIFGYYPTLNSGQLLNPGEYFEIAVDIAPPFAAINARNNSTVDGAMGLLGIAGGASGSVFGVVGQLETSTGAGAAGVRGFDSAGGSLNGFSHYSPSGVQGAFGGNGGNGYGVLGIANGTSGYAGAFARQDTTAPYALTSYTLLSGSATQAATFNGNVSVSGTLSKGGGSFKIDHPLDPENKYLYHSFVESPDMMNIYNGIVTLNGAGEAEVDLPDYFEALNRDFRYQLTSIGRAQPNLHIAEEVQNLRFRIAGGKPNARVSWQVTGIRQDPFANAHRIPVAEEKEQTLRGTLMHPVERGQGVERSEFFTVDGKPAVMGQRAPAEN